MEDRLKKIEEELAQELAGAKDGEAIEALRIKYLGRKGVVKELFEELAALTPDQKAQLGGKINALKNKITSFFDEKKDLLKGISEGKVEAVDVSMPGILHEAGHKHPITKVMEEINEVFLNLGFKIVDSPEIETEHYNFEALNIPLEHPSRDVFDTFYIENDILLRSHTSPAQIRIMEKERPPLEVITPGRVYRPDAVDASHCFMFHQVEGFMVDVDIKFSDLKGVLEQFAIQLFGPKTKVRFRPHFFPFTEPSAEVDVSCIICGGTGCRVCSGKGWLEILGSGMIHPNVFKAVKYDPKKYTGFAFGMGVERIAMLKYGIADIRLFFENDLRFLRQF